MHRILEFLRAIGPAIIVAAVVCGPGSILMSSKTGAIYGYRMIWVLVLAAALMWCMVILSARLGIVHKSTPIEELSRRLGRPVAAFIGIMLFLVVAGFQVSNNIAILAALEPFAPHLTKVVKICLLLGINAFIIMVLYGFRNLYKPIELLMKAIILCMVTAFVINLARAQPEVMSILRGLIPSPPEGGYQSFLSAGAAKSSTDHVLVLQALIATTFSVAGAFYQAYAVRAKGWTLRDARKGMVDSLVGISVLGGISLIVMSTAAAALHGNIDPANLKSVGDIASQLEPLFGSRAKFVFACGIFAGGFGAFMVNAMIGGNMLSDGFGKGATINDQGARHGTVAALLIGMTIAMVCVAGDISPVAAITVAQASTVLGLPALALALLYLATRPDLKGSRRVPPWMILTGGVGFLVSLLLATRTVLRLAANFAG